MADKVAKNRQQKGELVPGSKLTAGMVNEIRRRASEGISNEDLGKEYGVHRRTISDAVRMKTWK